MLVNITKHSHKFLKPIIIIIIVLLFVQNKQNRFNIVFLKGSFCVSFKTNIKQISYFCKYITKQSQERLINKAIWFWEAIIFF